MPLHDHSGLRGRSEVMRSTGSGSSGNQAPGKKKAALKSEFHFIKKMIAFACLFLCCFMQDAAYGRGGEKELYADSEMRRIEEILFENIEKPESLLLVAELADLKNEVTDLSALRRIFAESALDRRAHPELRAYSRLMAAKTEWRRGRIPRALQWMEHLGLFGEILFIGPFDNEGGIGFQQAWSPEIAELERRAPDLQEEHIGKEGPVSWRRIPDIFPLGYVDLSSLTDPYREVTVYLRAAVESDRNQSAALRMGMPGASKVWLNGMEIFSSKADHPARFDQHAVPVNLEEGVNVFLIKLTHRQGALGFYLRLTDVTGNPVRYIKDLPADTPIPSRRARRAMRPPAVDTVHGTLQKRVEEESCPQAMADYARILALRHPFDRTERLHLDAAKKALELYREENEASLSTRGGRSRADPKLAHLNFLVASYENDHNRQRFALEASVSADKDYIPALAGLGFYYRRRNESASALPYLKKVIEKKPGHIPVALALADSESDLFFREHRQRRIEQLVSDYPFSPLVISREASMAYNEGRLERAAARLRVGVGLYPGDRGLLSSLIAVVLDSGRFEEAVEIMSDAILFDPSSIHARLALAGLYSSNGKFDEAEEIFREAAALNPDMADIHYRHSLHYLRHGFRSEAQDKLNIAYSRRPQDPRLTELREALAEDQGRFYEPYLEDALQLASESALKMDSGEFPVSGNDTVSLGEVTVVKVHRSGLSTRVHQEIHRIITPGGAENLRNRGVVYTPGQQILRIEEARVIRPDGSVFQAVRESDISRSAPWARLYFDSRERIITYPDLSPGDVVELVWRLEDISYTNMFGDYFGDFVYFQSVYPIMSKKYVLIAPAEREFHFNEIVLPKVLQREEEDGSRVLVWEASDIEKIIPESGMPGWSEVAAFLHVSTYSSWQEVADWWWRLIKEQLRPSPALVSTAEDLVEGIPKEDLHGRVAAIHNYVVRQTRYVGLEFGIHSYKPYRVDQVHERRFGDCKDKSALMHALLGAVGIESRMVIIRSRNLGRVPDHPASLAVFNHAVLYVPDLDLWIDGTGEFSGTDEFPIQNHEGAALIVDYENRASRFVYAESSSSDDNTSFSRLNMKMNSDGSVSGEGIFTIKGAGAPGYRRSYQTEDRRKHLYEQEWAMNYPGIRIEKLKMHGIDNLEEEVSVDFSFSVPNFARRSGTTLSFRPTGEERGYAERFSPLAKRRHDLIINYPFTTGYKIRIDIPEGWEAAPPPPASLESDFGKFELGYEIEDNSLIISVKAVLDRSRISVVEYPEFRSFMVSIDRALQREIRLMPVDS